MEISWKLVLLLSAASVCLLALRRLFRWTEVSATNWLDRFAASAVAEVLAPRAKVPVSDITEQLLGAKTSPAVARSYGNIVWDVSLLFANRCSGYRLTVAIENADGSTMRASRSISLHQLPGRVQDMFLAKGLREVSVRWYPAFEKGQARTEP